MIQAFQKHLTDDQIRALMEPEAIHSGEIQVVSDEVANHLEHCELCQQRMELSVAEPWLWESAGQILEDAPELLNEDPYENWIVEVRPTDIDQYDELLSRDDYVAMLKG